MTVAVSVAISRLKYIVHYGETRCLLKTSAEMIFTCMDMLTNTVYRDVFFDIFVYIFDRLIHRSMGEYDGVYRVFTHKYKQPHNTAYEYHIPVALIVLIPK